MRRPRVCIDARMIRASGIGTYLRSLLDGLTLHTELPFDVTLLGRPEELPAGPWQQRKVTSRFYSLSEQWTVANGFFQAEGSLLHVPHYNVPLAAVSSSVVTVHDVIHLKFPNLLKNPLARLYSRFFLQVVVPRTRAILTVSEHSKKDLMAYLGLRPEQVHVAYPAISPVYRPRAVEERAAVRRELKLPERYFLYVGNVKESKNVPALLRMYALLRNRRADAPSLVLVGRNFIEGFEQRMRSSPGVEWRGEVPPESLPALYAAAEAFLFPSLYEGFGLPPLEALASGIPVISSNRASLPEVTGDAALLVDPLDEEKWSRTMEQVIDDKAMRSRLEAAGPERVKLFTLDRFTAQVIAVYRQALGTASR